MYSKTALKDIGLSLVLGGICFTVSQILLRLPLLQYLNQQVEVSLFAALHMLLYGLLLALSAGVFEESWRFLLKFFLLNSPKTEYRQPLAFGLGHGLTEAVYLLLPVISLVSFEQYWPALLERLMAMLIHVSLTFVIWNGFQLGKKWRYLLVAILLHGLLDACIPILVLLKAPVILTEGVILIFAVLGFIYCNYSRKYYPKRIKGAADEDKI